MKKSPKFDGPLRPEFKSEEFEKAVGKTVARVEGGAINGNADCHEREVVILHFTDGSALQIDIGSNAMNLSSLVSPSEISTDLSPSWHSH